VSQLAGCKQTHLSWQHVLRPATSHRAKPSPEGKKDSKWVAEGTHQVCSVRLMLAEDLADPARDLTTRANAMDGKELFFFFDVLNL